MHDQSIGHGSKTRGKAAIFPTQTDVTDLTTPGYSICSARAEHISALSAIERAAAQLLRDHAPESVLTETTDERTFADAARDGRLWVASAGNVPVGFALVRMLAHDLPHLEEIDVDPSHGRRGLGTALVKAVCEWATDSGYAVLTLTTFRAVPWNLPFYARMGFVEIPRETLRSELAAVVSEEAHRGLDPNTRAVMGYRCGPPAIREPRR
jgi:GNAT superfamily N-acetyltransferase